MSSDNICARLGIRHPQVRGLLTDLLIDLSSGKQLVIAVKPSSELAKLRVMEKLQIEKRSGKLAGSSEDFSQRGKYWLKLHPHTNVTSLCAKLDDPYVQDPGFHLSTLRHAVAYRFIPASLNKAFHCWTYGDLALRETVPVAGLL
jgi:hypothetical protein